MSGWLVKTTDDIILVPWEWPRSGLPQRHRRPSFSRERSWIYVLRDPRTMAARYVGRAQKLSDREYLHAYEPSTRVGRWMNELEAIGLSPLLVPIWLVMPGEDRAEWESRWIEYFRARGDKLLNVDPI